jgi:hypothetical protein
MWSFEINYQQYKLWLYFFLYNNKLVKLEYFFDFFLKIFKKKQNEFAHLLINVNNFRNYN